MMQSYSKSLITALTVLAIAACGGGGESDTADQPAAAAPATPAPPAAMTTADLPEGVTQAMVDSGRTLFNGGATCFACHGQNAVGTQLAPPLDDNEWLDIDGTYQGIINQINTGTTTPKQFPGVMLPRAGTQITDEQVAMVAAYVYSISR